MWRRTLTSLGLLAVLILAAAVLPFSQASAQTEDTSLNLTTSPLPLSLQTNPGDTTTADLRIKNSGTRTEELQITLFKFSAFGETGQPRLEDRGPDDDYFDWVSFSQDRFTAEPNVWNNITMTVNIPESAGLGYYYAVAFSRAGAAPDNPAGTGLQGATAVLVLLDVRSPNAKKEITVAEFTSSKRVYEFLPAEFNLKLTNSGNIHLAPTGTMFISQGGKEVGTVNVNETRGNLLPGTNRIFNFKWNEGYPVFRDIEENGKVATDKNGKPKRKLDWNLNNFGNFRIGKYTANLLMVYDDGQRDVPIEATVSFWVMPWRILGVVLLIIIVLGIGLWTMSRKLYRGTRKIMKKPKDEDKTKKPHTS